MKFKFQAQVAKTVNDLTLFDKNILICYKIERRFFERTSFMATKKSRLSDGALIADMHCPQLLSC